MVFALARALPFAGRMDWGTVVLPDPAGTVVALQQAVVGIETLMDALAPAFFSGQAADAVSRHRLREELFGFIAPPLHDRYTSLAPDFFHWLAR